MSFPPEDFQPRYAAYLRAHLLPDMRNMVDFMCWINRMWSDWRAARGLHHTHIASWADHADFDLWLQARFPVRCSIPKATAAPWAGLPLMQMMGGGPLQALTRESADCRCKASAAWASSMMSGIYPPQ